MTNGPQHGEGDTVWSRLRRRKVVQWGFAYAAGAWGVLQGLQFLADVYEWSSRVLKLSTLAFVLGLPVVLVLAWYRGDRGEQRVTRVELAIVTLLFLIGGGLFWRYHNASEPPLAAAAPASSGKTTEAQADPRPSIAVLPFDNRSAQQDDTYFVDGIHDDILTQLSKVSGMRVISRTSVEQFRDTKLPIKHIAEQLGVAQILEGGVQRAGDRVRVTVQLIDASTDAHLWAENYDRELTAANIFAIQSEVATAIAAALKATLTADEKARVDAVPTQNLEAWEAYQLGRQRLARRSSEGLLEAEKYFNTAIELDPEFALAYVGLADALTLQINYSAASKETQLSKADAAVQTALKLDPSLGEAWTSSAALLEWRGQFDLAEESFRRAIELNPNYATAHQWFGDVLLAYGRREEALRHATVAVGLDPLSVISNVSHGIALESVGRFDEAEKAYRKAIEIDPSLARGYAELGYLTAYVLNRFSEAVPVQERAVALDPGNPLNLVTLGVMYLDLGDVEQAARVASMTRERWPGAFISDVFASAVSMAQGDRDAAMRLMRAAQATEPRDALALSVLGSLYWESGDFVAPRMLYEQAYPEFFSDERPTVNFTNLQAALGLVPILLKAGERDRATLLLDQAAAAIDGLQRLSYYGYGLADVQIHALRGDKAKALGALRAAERAGWRGWLWRYYRDVSPTLESIRDEPEFKAVFVDIERDMARQRAALAARPKDAPRELGSN